MRRTSATAAIVLTALVLGSTAASAQTSTQSSSSSRQTQSTTTVVQPINFDLNRAKNLARQAAERANGGLSRYRAESAMHGPSREAPYVDNGNGTWTFTFRGGAPGSTTFTVESVVTVSRDTWQVTVDYNGSIR